jgi:TRAP-type C4-dicarboxylate transport system permease small subunit
MAVSPARTRSAVLGTGFRIGLSTAAGAVLFGIMMVSVIDVIGRYLLNRPLPGSSEITEVLMAILVYAGLPVVSQRNAHICVDMFGTIIPQRAVPIRNAANGLICTATLAVIAWRLWAYADQLSGWGVTEYLKLPQAPFAYAMSLLAGLAAAIEFYRVFKPVPPTDMTASDTA